MLTAVTTAKGNIKMTSNTEETRTVQPSTVPVNSNKKPTARARPAHVAPPKGRLGKKAKFGANKTPKAQKKAEARDGSKVETSGIRKVLVT